MQYGAVCLFFYINDHFLFHSCPLEKAETYGDYLIYPESHFDIWVKHYEKHYQVDFDFYPRGRVIYRKSDQTYRIYYDRCIGDEIFILIDAYYGGNVTLEYDEHYQCYRCNKEYTCRL